MTRELTASRTANVGGEKASLIIEALRRTNLFPTSECLTLRIRVQGESMLPSLWPGDTVEITPCSSSEARVGDIILALRDDRLFLHRMVSECTGSKFVLCGDSMPGPDNQYPSEALLARLVRRCEDGEPLPSLPVALSIYLRPGLGAKVARGIGMVLCHWNLARRIALHIHSRRNALRNTRSSGDCTGIATS